MLPYLPINNGMEAEIQLKRSPDSASLPRILD